MRERLHQETKAALKAQDRPRLGALRLISAALQEREIAARTDTLSDQEIAAVLQKMLKQRRESLAIYEQAGRQDLAAQEASEIVVIEEFLPQQMGEADVKAAIAAAIKEVEASRPQGHGQGDGRAQAAPRRTHGFRPSQRAREGAADGGRPLELAPGRRRAGLNRAADQRRASSPSPWRGRPGRARRVSAPLWKSVGPLALSRAGQGACKRITYVS